ncbi:MAG: polysaccharide deacetylase family protein [Actinomycetota bacterium]|nr:polysaccharide deacetylase family protein [Actinomycetota bacterium]
MSVVILLYHKVLEDPARALADPARLSVSDATFRQQLAVLAAESEIVPLSLALWRGPALARSGGRFACITFDDGYRATLERVSSALRDAGVSGTAFVSPGHAERPDLYWWDRLALLEEAGLWVRGSGGDYVEAHLRGLEYASASAWVDSLVPGWRASGDDAAALRPADWNDLRTLDPGAFELGCHALHHDCLAALPLARVRRELRRAARAFADQCLAAIPVLAYPYGYDGCVTTDQVREAVAVHFTWAMSSVRGRLFEPEPANRFFLRRVYAEEWDGERFRDELRRAFIEGA